MLYQSLDTKEEEKWDLYMDLLREGKNDKRLESSEIY